MSESLKYCQGIMNRLESRFTDLDISFGPDRMGKSKVGYDFNLDNFRSDNFMPSSGDTPSLLFAGCSMTFGFGVELEKTYAYRIYKHLLDKKQALRFINIAVPGYSSIQAMLSIFDYIELYGNPNTIVLLMPQLERDAAFFLNYNFEINYKNQRSKEDQIMDFSKYFPMFFRIYKALYFYCKENNIRLVSSHWHETDMIFQGDRNFPNYNDFSIGYFLQHNFPDSYKNLITKDFDQRMFDYAETNKNEKNVIMGDDDDHPGNAWHYAMSKVFISEFNL
jgi:hypothetical protein